MIINKFIIIEIKETNIINYEVNFDINFQTASGFDSHVEAQKKLNALNELQKDLKYSELQYKIIQIPYNTAFKDHKKSA